MTTASSIARPTRLKSLMLAILLPLALGACGINNIPTKEEQAKAALADVQAQYQRRSDLIPNLVETVKGYASHERGTLDAVTQARAAAAGATSVNDKVQAENMLTATLGRLFAVAEAYPDLKANTNYLELQRELSDIENKLAAARRFFNNAVSEFNAVRRQFPTVLFAGMVGFGADKPFFDVGEGDRAAMNAAPPKVSFTA